MSTDQFSAVCIFKHLSVRKNLTSDPEVFQIIKGMNLKFEKNPPQFSVEHEILTKQNLF